MNTIICVEYLDTLWNIKYACEPRVKNNIIFFINNCPAFRRMAVRDWDIKYDIIHSEKVERFLRQIVYLKQSV